MHHVFLLGQEGINHHNFLLYNITNSLINDKTNNNIIYHVSSLNKSKNSIPKHCNGNIFFNIRLLNIGCSTYLIYDLINLIRAFYYIKKNKLNNSSIFLLSTRIGIFLPFFIKKFKKYNISIYLYCERDNIEENNWTFFIKKLWEKSEYFCIKYSKMLISTKPHLKEYFSETYKNIASKIISLDCDFSTFDSTFELFLKKFNLIPYNYYLLIDDFRMTSKTDFIIEQFLKCDTTKKLIILSKKTSLLYKHSVASLNFFKDNRIICLNIERFIHLIPHLSTYCHAYIHSSINAASDKNYFKNDNINLILESPLNSQINLPNSLYFNEKSFLDAIKKCDNVKNKRANLKNTHDIIIKLVKAIEDTLTKNQT